MRFKTKSLKSRRREFVNNTVAYYSKDPNRRAMNKKGACKYYYRGKKCAIGRFIPKNKYKENFDISICGGGAIEDRDDVFAVLPKQIRDLGIDFLSHIQSLHDDDDYWTEKSISELGMDRVKEIKNKFC